MTPTKTTVSVPANLKPGEEVYTANGQMMTVRITRIASTDRQCMVLELTGRLVQADGTDSPVPFELPAHRHTVYLAALADGSATADQVVADLKAKALEQWPALLAGKQAFNAIPFADAPKV